MVRLTIDNQAVDVPPGSTILDAARKLGIDIPALCYLDGHAPRTSCMLCLVRVKDRDRLLPSCATPAEEGMQIESETEDVRGLRRTGLELLLADHAGDCKAPCETVCPAGMDIPLMLRQIADDQWTEAIATVKEDIALPAILGRVCPELCEKGCRLGDVDRPASICQLKRMVADIDLASGAPYLPPREPASGKTVAIVGAGSAGLAAAYHLLQAGHACTVFEKQNRAAGTLRSEYDAAQLPPEVIDAEVGVIEKLGASFRLGTAVGRDISLENLRGDFDAVLLAVGALTAESTEALGLRATKDHLVINRQTQQTELEGVFAAGRAARPGKLVVRNVADGKRAAVCINQYLSGVPVAGPADEFNCRIGRIDVDELAELVAGTGRACEQSPPLNAVDHPTPEQAAAEAGRCLQCDCPVIDTCRLRHYAEAYGAKMDRYRGDRRVLRRHLEHGEITYEPGKCILCGLCIEIAREEGEPVGLAFVGRGFDVRVDVPFDGSIADALQRAARRCAEACPSGALVLRSEGCQGGICPGSSGGCGEPAGGH